MLPWVQVIAFGQPMISGSCLCGSVSFEVQGEVTDIYQCHCSVCRKALGSSGVSLLLGSGRDFKWHSGEENTQIFKTPSGYQSVFCKTCGSHVPDPNPEKTTYWIPAGLLDDTAPHIKIGAHVFVESKAHWDVIGGSGIQYPAGFPD